MWTVPFSFFKHIFFQSEYYYHSIDFRLFGLFHWNFCLVSHLKCFLFLFFKHKLFDRRQNFPHPSLQNNVKNQKHNRNKTWTNPNPSGVKSFLNDKSASTLFPKMKLIFCYYNKSTSNNISLKVCTYYAIFGANGIMEYIRLMYHAWIFQAIVEHFALDLHFKVLSISNRFHTALKSPWLSIYMQRKSMTQAMRHKK